MRRAGRSEGVGPRAGSLSSGSLLCGTRALCLGRSVHLGPPMLQGTLQVGCTCRLLWALCAVEGGVMSPDVHFSGLCCRLGLCAGAGQWQGPTRLAIGEVEGAAGKEGSAGFPLALDRAGTSGSLWPETPGTRLPAQAPDRHTQPQALRCSHQSSGLAPPLGPPLLPAMRLPTHPSFLLCRGNCLFPAASGAPDHPVPYPAWPLPTQGPLPVQHTFQGCLLLEALPARSSLLGGWPVPQVGSAPAA